MLTLIISDGWSYGYCFVLFLNLSCIFYKKEYNPANLWKNMATDWMAISEQVMSVKVGKDTGVFQMLPKCLLIHIGLF